MKEYIFSYIKGELQESRNSWSNVVLHIQCLLHPTWLYSASFQTYFSPYFRNLCDFGVIWFFLISIKCWSLKIPKQSTSLMNTNLCTSVCKFIRKSYSQMRLVWYGQCQYTSILVLQFCKHSFLFLFCFCFCLITQHH